MNNPYDAPVVQPNSSATSDGRVRCVGDALVVPKGTTLPDTCLYTGLEGKGAYESKKLSWAPPWVYIFILFNIIVLLIIYLIIRKQGDLTYYVDSSIVRRRSSLGWTWGGVMVAMVVTLVAGIVMETGAVIGIGAVALLVALIILLVKLPKLKIAKIDKTDIYLKGVPVEVCDRIIARMYPA